MNQFFASGGQIIGVSDSASVLPMNIQDWFHLGWTSWISLLSKRLSRAFSNTVQKHKFFSVQPSLRLNIPACIGEGNGNPLQYSCLENSRDRGAWQAAVHGVTQSRTRLKWLSSSSSSSSLLYEPTLTSYMTTGKTIVLTRRKFDSKVMSLLFNMLPKLVIAFLPRSKCLLTSWLQSPCAVILESKKTKSITIIFFKEPTDTRGWWGHTFLFHPAHLSSPNITTKIIPILRKNWGYWREFQCTRIF